jgi:hypothetical protein
MLTIAAIVAIVAVVNAVISASGVVEDRIASQIEIVHATGQNASPDANVWAKNIGATAVEPLTRVDVFFGPSTDFQRIPYGGASCAAPCWEYTLENGTSNWEQTSTLRITIHASSNLATGTSYYVKVVTPNGIADSKVFTV